MHRRPSTNVTKFTAIAVNGFYTMTRSGLMTTADSDSPENIQCDELRTLAADEKAMKELYAQAEVLQTATQPKRLVVYKEYLLWFRDLPTNDEPRVPDSASTPHKGTLGAEALTSCSTSKASSPKRNTPVLEGYANIRGMYVESNHSTKIHLGIDTKRIFENENAGHSPSLNATFIAVEYSSQKQVQFMIKIQKELNKLHQEVLLFQRLEDLLRWRSLVAQALVLFTDIALHFDEIGLVANDAHCQVIDVRRKADRLALTAEHYKLHPTLSQQETVSRTLRVLSVCQVLQTLHPLGLAAQFVEAHHVHQGIVVLTRPVHGPTLANWARDIWLAEKFDTQTDKRLSLMLLRELSRRMAVMHSAGVVHGQLRLAHIRIVRQNAPAETGQQLRSESSGSIEVKSSRRSLDYSPSAVADWSYVFQGFDNAYQCHPWTSNDLQQSAFLHNQVGKTSTPFSDVNSIELGIAKDVWHLGSIFLQLIYGLDIFGLLDRNGTEDSSFAQRLLVNPYPSIVQLDQQHKIGKQGECLIAAMLSPDWQLRPTAYEVYEILQSLLDEHSSAEHQSFQPKPRSWVLDRASEQEGTITDIFEPAMSRAGRFVSRRLTTIMMSTRKVADKHLDSEQALSHPQVGRLLLDYLSLTIGTQQPLDKRIQPDPRPSAFLNSNNLKFLRSLEFEQKSSAVNSKILTGSRFGNTSNNRPTGMDRDKRSSSVLHLRSPASKLQPNQPTQDRCDSDMRSVPTAPRSPVPLMIVAGRDLLSPQNKLKRVVLPAGESVILTKRSIALSQALNFLSNRSGKSLSIQHGGQKKGLDSPIHSKEKKDNKSADWPVPYHDITPALTLRVPDHQSSGTSHMPQKKVVPRTLHGVQKAMADGKPTLRVFMSKKKQLG